MHFTPLERWCEDPQRIQRVAVHAFRLLQSLEHPGILAVRLDHFLTTRGDRLTFDLRLHLLWQLAEPYAMHTVSVSSTGLTAPRVF
jgi:hypothetical protein